MTGRYRAKLTGLCAVGALVLAGCGGGSTANGSGGEPDRNGTLVISFSIAPTSFDPHRSLSDNDVNYLREVYDTLTDLDAEGRAVPMLAESWELAPDGSTLTFKLRRDASFSDGSPVDAAAVKANLDRLLGDPALTTGRQVAAAVESVEAKEPDTVVLHLKGPGGSLPLLFAGRPGMIIAPDAIDNPDLDQHPVGSGAMELTESSPGSSYEYTRRKDYWDDKAYRVAKLKVVVQPDYAQSLAALQSGQASLMSGGSGDIVEEAEAAGLKAVMPKIEPVDFYRLALNTQRGEFGKREVRQAISSAIDREAINQGAYSGLCPARVNPFPEDYFAHGAAGNDKDWGYDEDRARELLAAAGLSDGFTMEIGTIATSSMSSMAQIIQAKLKEVGITVKIVTLDSTQLRARFASGDIDSVLGLVTGPPDPSNYYAENQAPNAGSNPGGLTSAKLEALAPTLQSSDDADELAKVYVPFMDALFEMGPSVIPLCGWNRGYVVRPEVGGVTFRPTGGGNFRSVYVTK